MAKCFVTGESANGRSHAASSEIELQALGGGFLFAHIWGSDEAPSFPNDGTPPAFGDLFPGPNGYRATFMHILPSQTVLAAERDGAVTGEAPGMHRSDTVDIGIVTAGTVHMELDTGEVLQFNTGDIFVQNGTSHCWYNRGDVPASVFVVLIGGHPRS
ncbi:MAG: cupin domain-containing protein [Novosphingobium sp.]|nr:cupin domain-containing protein [Sphingobium sp.]MCB2050897.1 cupin domain-containing protein [Novosphingobium sp.]MCP5398185.1 cupin domain-containing protein [Sphingomonas sp.]